MYTGKNFNEKIKEVGFLILLILLFCLILTELKYFLSSILGAFTLYMILRNSHKKLLSKGLSDTLAATALISVTFLVVVIVGGAISSTVYVKIKHFNPQIILDNIQLIHDKIVKEWGFNIFSEDLIEKGVNQIGSLLPGIIAATGNFISNVIVMVFVLFFMLQQSHDFEKRIENFLPISNDSVRLLKKEANSMIISNAIGVPMIMLFQGLAAALAYWISGAGDPIIWGLLTGFIGLIPVIGTASVWLPLSINLFIGGYTWQSIFLVIWGVCIISSIDNVFRMVFLKKQANVHPLTALFGVMLGINLFGFWGIIFGPLVISGFLLLLKIFRREFLTE
jgi:predicted PurR-regulated permease PerM